MLILSREKDQQIVIGDDIVITVTDINGGKVKLGITAPKEISVHRFEIWASIKRERAALPAE